MFIFQIPTGGPTTPAQPLARPPGGTSPSGGTPPPTQIPTGGTTPPVQTDGFTTQQPVLPVPGGTPPPGGSSPPPDIRDSINQGLGSMTRNEALIAQEGLRRGTPIATIMEQLGATFQAGGYYRLPNGQNVYYQWNHFVYGPSSNSNSSGHVYRPGPPVTNGSPVPPATPDPVNHGLLFSARVIAARNLVPNPDSNSYTFVQGNINGIPQNPPTYLLNPDGTVFYSGITINGQNTLAGTFVPDSSAADGIRFDSSGDRSRAMPGANLISSLRLRETGTARVFIHPNPGGNTYPVYILSDGNLIRINPSNANDVQQSSNGTAWTSVGGLNSAAVTGNADIQRGVTAIAAYRAALTTRNTPLLTTPPPGGSTGAPASGQSPPPATGNNPQTPPSFLDERLPDPSVSLVPVGPSSPAPQHVALNQQGQQLIQSFLTSLRNASLEEPWFNREGIPQEFIREFFVRNGLGRMNGRRFIFLNSPYSATQSSSACNAMLEIRDDINNFRTWIGERATLTGTEITTETNRRIAELTRRFNLSTENQNSLRELFRNIGEQEQNVQELLTIISKNPIEFYTSNGQRVRASGGGNIHDFFRIRGLDLGYSNDRFTCERNPEIANILNTLREFDTFCRNCHSRSILAEQRPGDTRNEGIYYVMCALASRHNATNNPRFLGALQMILSQRVNWERGTRVQSSVLARIRNPERFDTIRNPNAPNYTRLVPVDHQLSATEGYLALIESIIHGNSRSSLRAEIDSLPVEGDFVVSPAITLLNVGSNLDGSRTREINRRLRQFGYYLDKLSGAPSWDDNVIIQPMVRGILRDLRLEPAEAVVMERLLRTVYDYRPSIWFNYGIEISAAEQRRLIDLGR